MKKNGKFSRFLSAFDPRWQHVHPLFLFDKRFGFFWLLIFWPLFGLAFYAVEGLDASGLRTDLTSIWCPLDDYIPFCEWFLFPYLFWFIFLVGMYAYTVFFEVDLFKKLMYFTIATYTFTVIVYLLFPNMQELRPAEFPRDNFLTRFMAGYYEMDTNTNVLPSLHVIGAFAVQTAAWHSKRLGTTPWRIAFTVTAILISLSTVFLKQHSILDVFAGLLVCLPAYILVYRLPLRPQKKAAAIACDGNN